MDKKEPKPAILAPAGTRDSFLAALAAGAEAVYCGLKRFSARMEARNFGLDELASLTELAHAKGTAVYVTLNTLLSTGDLKSVGESIAQLDRQVHPDGLIVQDPAVFDLAGATGFSGEIHLSTLANVSFSAALPLIRQKLRADRVVLPRELNIDEIKAMAAACPPGMGLEVFVHGALCYAVSGRCYWSSFLGGKSGLRGRCVQPCRRVYRQDRRDARFFSCQDLSLDVLVKVLLSIPQIRAWKIEGRKKGPHYVYYTTSAYRMLRDHHADPRCKKDALELLARALGRPGTHYHFLTQRPQTPVRIEEQTGSGMLIGRVKGGQRALFFSPNEALLPGDRLRIGYEDAPGHTVRQVKRAVPKGGRFHIQTPRGRGVRKGTPVFLIDRRERALQDALDVLASELKPLRQPTSSPKEFRLRLPSRPLSSGNVQELNVFRYAAGARRDHPAGIWLSPQSIKALSKALAAKAWWWLPPVIWPSEESGIRRHIDGALKRGARRFVLNAPWQTSLFRTGKKLELWAGPFCNLANPLALAAAGKLGLQGVIVSPELSRDDYLQLPRHSPLPLGLVISGNWPICISRTLTSELQPERPFTSPKGEQSWAVRYGPDIWLFPNWKIDLESRRAELGKAGYELFVHLHEPVPKAVKMKKRPGLWNFANRLL